MSPQTTTFVSILSILLINPLNAQTGKGCHFTTCPEAGQVRIDATFNAQNNFLGGCHCGCDPSLYDSSNANYCDNPRQINFNPATLKGDCTCNCPGQKLQCTYPKIWDAIECECACPSFLKTKPCNSPAMWRADICACTCTNGIGSIDGPCIENGRFIGGNVLPDCTCDIQINNNNNIQCPGVQIIDATSGTCMCPSFMSSSSTCTLPRIWNEANCFCGCAIGSIGGPCVDNGNFIQGSTVQPDCTCDYGVNNNIQCPGVQIIDPTSGTCVCPSFMSSSSSCTAPRIWNEANCFCGCAIGSIGGPCVDNGYFIQGSNVQADCTCDYGVNNNVPTYPNINNPFAVNAACRLRGDACTIDEDCCTHICKISGFCW